MHFGKNIKQFIILLKKLFCIYPLGSVISRLSVYFVLSGMQVAVRVFSKYVRFHLRIKVSENSYMWIAVKRIVLKGAESKKGIEVMQEAAF